MTNRADHAAMLAQAARWRADVERRVVALAGATATVAYIVSAIVSAIAAL